MSNVESPVAAPDPAVPDPAPATSTEIGMVTWVADPGIAFEEIETSDGRMFRSGSIVFNREFPLSLMYLDFTPQWGHDGAVAIGRIDMAEMRNGALYAEGVIDATTEEGKAAVRKIAAGILNRVSVDIAPLDYEYVEDAQFDPETGEAIKYDSKFVVLQGELMGATVCAMSAFGDAKIKIIDEPAALVAAGFQAPPAEFFTDPKLDGPTHVTVTEDGRVFGHIATWNTCHTSFPDRCVKAPKSGTDYAGFKRNQFALSDGSMVNAGVLTIDASHPDIYLDADATKSHYDHTGTAVADVIAGEDEHGVWISGAVRPYVTEDQKLKMERCDWSGDWRPFGANLELFAILGVNTPGFPVLQAGYVKGRQISLVASAQFQPMTDTQPEPSDAEMQRAWNLLPYMQKMMLKMRVEQLDADMKR